MELQQRTLENRDQFDLDAALDDISLHSLLSDEHHNFGVPELDVSLSQASLERGNAVQPSSQHTHQQTKGQLGDVLQNGTGQQQKQNTPKGRAGRRGRAPADPSQLTEKQLRTREANRKFEERQRQLREETEARLDAIRAELERERAALASARTTNALYDNMLDYKERMIQALQHCKQAHPFSGFVIPPLMVDIIQQEHVLHDFGADNIMRYAAAGYTGHMDGGGRVREAPPFEVVLADWRDIAEQLRGVVEDARAAGAGCAPSVDGADTLSSQLSSGQHSVHSAPANPSMSSRPSGNSCAWAAGQGSEQQQVQRAESAHASSGLAGKGEAAPVPSDATTHSQSTLCPPVRLGHLSYPTESQQVSSLVALASQRGGTAGSLGMGTAGTTTGGGRALLSGRQQPMVFGPGKGAEDVPQLPSSGEGGPQAGSMGISSSSEVIWLAARGSHHGHLQEQFQRRGMQPQQPQQAVSPVAESRAPGGPLTQELKGGAFAATSCCLLGPSGTGPPAAAAASPKGAGRGEGCGEGQVQGVAVSRLFTRSTSTSFVMLDALDAGMVLREEEEGEVYRFTGAQLRHCFVQLTRVGLLGWQQALLFPQHFRQLLGVRLDTGGVESPSQDTLPHWRNVVRQLRLRPQQMAELASMYRSMCSRRLEPAAQERREVARRLAEAEGVEVATASQQLHAGHTLVMTEVRQALEQSGQQVEAALAGMVSGVFDLMDFPMQTARLVLLSWPYFPQAHLLGLAATLEMEDSSPAPAQQGCASSASDV